jgi:hypothetical protein
MAVTLKLEADELPDVPLVLHDLLGSMATEASW